VLNKLGPQIQWIHSYVTDNKLYCVYIAPNEEMVREHARLGGSRRTRSAVGQRADPLIRLADHVVLTSSSSCWVGGEH
jgi:hypothetical protein